jgi:hypothetical protein
MFPGGSVTNTLSGSAPVQIQWSDPWGASGNDYDLYMINSSGNVVSQSTNSQNGDDFPYEGVSGANGSRAVIYKYSGSPRFLRLAAFRATWSKRTNGQTYAHHTARYAFDVAAVSAFNRTNPFTAANNVEAFSSDGPRKIFFNANGSAITPGNFLDTGGTVRNKPDIAAADGTASSLPSNSGFNPFYGTSAAAPHAAAIAALILQHDSSHDFDSLLDLFSQTSLDIMSPGWDVDSGVGIVMAEPAITEQVQNSYKKLTATKTTLTVGESTTGKITLSTPAPPSGLTFTLDSANNSLVHVPATVTVNGGQSSKTFTIQGVAATAGTLITATLNPSGPAKNLNITVGSSGTLPQVNGLSLGSTLIYGGDTTTGTVTLDGPAPRSMVVTLLTSDAGLATVPATVTVAKNQTSATFTINSSAVASQTAVRITAKRVAGGRAFADLSLRAPKIISLGLNPATVNGGNNSTGTITLNFPAPGGGLLINLVSSKPSRASVLTQVKVAAGNTTKTFTVSTTAGPKTTAKITASRTGSASASKTLTIN